ncbi:MbtH family protein [Streptomyces sp. NRRL S-118]|uniref:MbtH family protein n=1 Tax=Streptomyces sp. NRRL S-118 TaxID=1463881 RepID=UPI0004C83939|nr:MbtH family protein [Streptomyces sp. NRRL S-118]
MSDVPTNPFEDEDGLYLVLVNDEGQHSLWPDGIDVPAGWTVALGASPRRDAVAYVETHWTDLRPAGVVGGA